MSYHTHATAQKRPRTDENENENINAFSTNHPHSLPLNTNPNNLKVHTQPLYPILVHSRPLFAYDPLIFDQPATPAAMGLSTSTNTINTTPSPPTNPMSSSSPMIFRFIDGFTPVPPTVPNQSPQPKKPRRSNKGTTRTYTVEEVANLREQRALRAERKRGARAEAGRKEREKLEREEREGELEFEAARLAAALKGIEAAGYPTLNNFLDAVLRLSATPAPNTISDFAQFASASNSDSSQLTTLSSLVTHPLFDTIRENRLKNTTDK
ncbi:hypothetical protein GALMADRAFT_235034 [Galerina marginata CBS 339.88]|uniref:Uncharacterized protein n=1 Tax=Galerina marginata (strain CBS 339.88) TaxID=685588 RepID=A0A067TRP8_GALM3|nr:hypothetical protein GALMADRAFT_235034 [Galerina marginata CBS 339.88]